MGKYEFRDVQFMSARDKGLVRATKQYNSPLWNATPFSQKGEVYARGVLKHTENDHVDLDLGTIRWHLVVHNVQGQSYTLSGSQAQFD